MKRKGTFRSITATVALAATLAIPALAEARTDAPYGSVTPISEGSAAHQQRTAVEPTANARPVATSDPISTGAIVLTAGVALLLVAGGGLATRHLQPTS